MRALAGPGADQIAQSALARVAGDAHGCEEPRERAFAEAVRLNRQRLRDVSTAARSDCHKDGHLEPDRRDSGLAAQIAHMPLDEREILLIVALARFGYDSASRILEIPRSSVLSRLMRARARLDGVKGAVHRSGHLRLVK